jgi:hypothetical protein
LTDIPESQLLVARCGDKHVAVGAPRQGLDHVVVLEGKLRLSIFKVPELDGVIARRGGKDVLSSRVEQDVADLPTWGQLCSWHKSPTPHQSLPSVSAQLSHRRNILRLFRIAAHGEVVRDPPQAHLSIVTSTGKDVVVERVPVVVQHGGSVSSEQRHDIGQLSSLFQRDDGECAAAGGLPVDGQVLGVTFHEVGVPGVLADAEVVVALLALAGLSEDVSWWSRGQDGIVGAIHGGLTYGTWTLSRSGPTLVRGLEGVGEGLVYLYNWLSRRCK